MLCSSTGRYEWKAEAPAETGPRSDRGGEIRFNMDPGEHPLFLRKEDVIRHAEWLRGMKEQFLARRKELKEVVRPYLGIGTYIERKNTGGT